MTAQPSPTPSEQNLLLPGGKVDPDAVRRAWDAIQRDGCDGPGVRVHFTLARDLRTRLDKYLTTRITFLSRTQLQQLIEAGAVTVNARPARAATKLRLGDQVVVELPPPPATEIQPEDIPIDVLFEDEHLLVLNKADDIIVHPARTEQSGTLVNAVAGHLQRARSGELSPVGADLARPGVVHRLDRRTTGCIVFAKSEQAHWKLGWQFEHRTVQKRYLALVHGWVDPTRDVVDLPLGPHQSRVKGYREMRVVRHDALGKPSVTIYQVRARWRAHDRSVGDQQFSLIEVELKTGRTHQIRVHLAHLGFPIVGDTMYGGRPFEHAGQTLLDRQALHAASLTLDHPITGAPMRWSAPVPADVQRVIALLDDAGVGEQVPSPDAQLDLSELLADPPAEG